MYTCKIQLCMKLNCCHLVLFLAFSPPDTMWYTSGAKIFASKVVFYINLSLQNNNNER